MRAAERLVGKAAMSRGLGGSALNFGALGLVVVCSAFRRAGLTAVV